MKDQVSFRAPLLTAAILFFSLAAAHAADIQMLPPLQGISPVPGVASTCPSGSSRMLTWDGTNPIGCTPGVTVDPSDNLSVGGSVQVSNDSVCSATKGGALRWTGTEVDVCNGAAWVPLGGNSGNTVSFPYNGHTYSVPATVVCTNTSMQSVNGTPTSMTTTMIMAFTSAGDTKYTDDGTSGHQTVAPVIGYSNWSNRFMYYSLPSGTETLLPFIQTYLPSTLGCPATIPVTMQ